MTSHICIVNTEQTTDNKQTTVFAQGVSKQKIKNTHLKKTNNTKQIIMQTLSITNTTAASKSLDLPLIKSEATQKIVLFVAILACLVTAVNI